MGVIIEQAGAVAFRESPGGFEFLLVRAKRNPQHWIFPKGHIEPGETAAEAAVRELQEEAGVAGRVIEPLGDIEFTTGMGRFRVQYFLCEWERQAGIGEGRESRWLSAQEAVALLPFPDSRKLVEKAAGRLSPRQPS